MKIIDREILYGAALAKITEHASFKSLKRGSAKGDHLIHIVVNSKIHVIILLFDKEDREIEISRDDEQSIKNVCEKSEEVRLVIVCRDRNAPYGFALPKEMLQDLLGSLTYGDRAIRIVGVTPTGMLKVRGNRRELRPPVKGNSFPYLIFE